MREVLQRIALLCRASVVARTCTRMDLPLGKRASVMLNMHTDLTGRCGCHCQKTVKKSINTHTQLSAICTCIFQPAAGDKGGKNARPDLVVAPSADGRIRHSRALDEKLVERPTVGPKAGKTMRVAGGRHDGLLVELLAQLPQVGRRASSRCVLRCRRCAAQDFELLF